MLLAHKFHKNFIGHIATGWKHKGQKGVKNRARLNQREQLAFALNTQAKAK